MGHSFRRLFRFVLILTILIVIGIVAFRHKYFSPIRGLAETQVRNATSDLINDAIDKQIETGNIQYDRIVYFEKDLEGRITALKTNMSEVNRLKTNILNIINDSVENDKTAPIDPIRYTMIPARRDFLTPNFPEI